MAHQAAHEILAARHLLDRAPLVGLVRLGDVARTADHRGNTGVVKVRRLGAERNLARPAVRIARVAQASDLAAILRIEPGQRGELIELEVRRGIDGVAAPSL